MIFGGLEIVAGGYLLHRHYRKKNEKERVDQDTQHKRNKTFPGATCTKQQQNWPQQANHHAQHQQPPAIPPQKYACYAPVVPQQPRPQFCQSQAEPQANTQFQHRPHAPPHTQSFNIPRRPVPQRKPQIIIQPSLQRSDSFATLSRMPIANGTRPQNAQEQESRALSPAIPRNGPYGNAGFSVSTPAFGATPTSPGLTYEMAGDQAYSAGHTANHDWETYRYEHGHQGAAYTPTVSTELGEYDAPPPPYRP
ncbi:repeatdomain containing protein [Pyrenophora tritici-repentis]|uniref:PAT1 multi-domain protein n=2 Tax=Pyrenophora tritici-repentis TaxID=45151 RepID=A0A2W1FE15_9PLEO|nr:uncharacterized protein PTRG_01365 [Pyrenophora tritici-repentis Pt-1C-BFP]KAA8626015.1 PAT1 multi-domain protein [Pyrenophora tritici-repentis]EDU40803.1 conserved hypothetical protein [Pyrenophora tritici-repentis Pt-1C-BFP]KAF7454428.1 PAT1 multi-domain protein [Pyrenophora tritici-repentis]KAF7577548.1 PAT1 multi-domain protein [Pyrenophora tritici-repentis]KAI0569525.1 PAT1 multi-domain protein [Pyrenophora tritici-repentis]